MQPAKHIKQKCAGARLVVAFMRVPGVLDALFDKHSGKDYAHRLLVKCVNLMDSKSDSAAADACAAVEALSPQPYSGSFVTQQVLISQTVVFYL